jgi:hypothetical protein
MVVGFVELFLAAGVVVARVVVSEVPMHPPDMSRPAAKTAAAVRGRVVFIRFS